MRRQIGEKSLSIWLEFLSIADRNKGELPGELNEIIRLVAGRCQATRITVTAVYQYAVSHMWLTCQPTLRVSKWSKYNKTRGTDKHPLLDNTIQYNTTKPPKSPKGGPTVDLAFERFWDAYPRKVAKGAAIKAWKKEAVYFTDIQDKILQSLARQKNQPQWLKDDGQFIPHPATWLNQQRWEDGEPVKIAVKAVPKPPILTESRPQETEKVRGMLADLVGKFATGGK